MTEGVKLIFWIAAVHIVGLACVGVLLLPALRDDSAATQWTDGESDDGWGGGAKTPPIAARAAVRRHPAAGFGPRRRAPA